MAEIHAFKPDGTPSPGAQAALDDATTGLATETYVDDAVTGIPEATTDTAGLMTADDKATLGAYRVGPENVFAGEGAGAAGDVAATMAGSGGAGGYENTLVGSEAGAANDRGWKNTAVGAAAMRDNVDGYFNVAVGNSAMERTVGGLGDDPKGDNDPGARNTAVGSNALRYNETGRANTAIGRNAAHSSLSGSYITAVGTNAYSGTVDGDVHSAKTASNVVAVGYGAGFFNDANDCTAVGVRALYQSKEKESYGGTAVGNRALELAEARECAALGNKAGRNILSGRFNLAIGPRSLGEASEGVTGDANTAIGAASVQTLTSGQYNIGIGQETLEGLETGSRNTAIGHQAGMGMPEDVISTTAIGAGARAHHVNSVAVGQATETTAGDQFAVGRRHLEIGKAYGAPAAPSAGVRLWAEGDGESTVLKAILPGGKVVTLT